MKEIGTLLGGVILISIIFISIGTWQSEMADIYGVEYIEEDFMLANVTEEIVNISSEIEQDVETLTVPTTSLSEKASAFIGGTLQTGRLVLRVPSIFSTLIGEFGGRTQLPIVGFAGLITLAILVYIIFRVLAWRRGGG